MRGALLAAAAAATVALAGCGSVTMKHEVAPIFVTVDINIKVQEKLEQFFDFEKARGALPGGAPALEKGALR